MRRLLALKYPVCRHIKTRASQTSSRYPISRLPISETVRDAERPVPSSGYSGAMSGELPKVTLVPGDGVVVRTPAFFCVVAAAVPAEVLDAIADIESAVETPEGVTRRGRHLARAIRPAGWPAPEVDIAFAAIDRVGIAAF